MNRKLTHGQYCLIDLYQFYRTNAANSLRYYRQSLREGWNADMHHRFAIQAKAKAEGIFLAMNILDYSLTLKDVKTIDPSPYINSPSKCRL